MWDEQGPCGLDESLLFSMPVLSQCFLAFLDLGRAFSSVTRYQVLLKPGVLRPTAPLSLLGQEQADKGHQCEGEACGCSWVRGTACTEPPAGPLHTRLPGQQSAPPAPPPARHHRSLEATRPGLGGKSFQTSLLGADWPSQTRPGRGSQWETRAARCGRGWDRGRALLARALPGIVVARAG